ncbi:hypothetical protein OEZ85_005618 [Tetradesmus obliquus]|uniref:serine O-acetyltransferase n=1 Tax=Tetradesmus obliquus TaxID=3088 RepID=A0ABY8UEA6_TETOB|nr:hypothetical protein OEZ85_005618 [Tetradesmus obliquus]
MQAMGLLQHPSYVNVSLGAASSSGLVPGGVVVVRRRRQRILLQATRDASSSNGKGMDEDTIWSQLAFPSYLQSRESHKKGVCRDFDKAIAAAERKQGADASFEEDLEEEDPAEAVWLAIRREAERDAATEPLLSSFLYATILAHDSFERALAFVLSNRLANTVMLPTQLFETFYEVLISDADVRQGALADVEACRERDPACTSYSQALLYYKGYHAIQTHRIAHALWTRGQKVMAVALQSRVSEVLAVDLHPAARLGHGILLDHGTGVVIGETAVIGNNVSLLQNVTLGGTGKDHGDRHPKISDNVLIGASATVLGNIRIGEGAQIAAGSLVLKPVAPHTMVAGSPAKPVGTVTGNPAEKMQQWSKKLNYDPFADEGCVTEADSRPESPLAEQPAAAAAAAPSSSSSSKSRRRPGKLDVAASEAAWDAVAARTMDGTDSSGSSIPASIKQVSGMHVHVNGKHHPAAANGNGSSSSKLSAAEAAAATGRIEQQQQAAAAAAGSSADAQQQQQHWNPEDAKQYMYEQVTGHQHLQPPLEHSHEQQQQQEQQPAAPKAAAADAKLATAAERLRSAAALGGVHGGEVDATIDEVVAAEKWAEVAAEDPEYVI